MKIIKSFFLFIIIMFLNIILSFDSSNNAFPLFQENDNYWDFLQLYEDCFNGIDDDGDNLIDRQDVFDC